MGSREFWNEGSLTTLIEYLLAGMEVLETVTGLLTVVWKFHFLVVRGTCKDLKEKDIGKIS